MKTLAFLLNVYADTLDTDTIIMPTVAMCNALSRKFKVKLVVYTKLVGKLKPYLDPAIQMQPFDYKQFFATDYILDIKKLDQFASRTFDADYVVSFGMCMSAAQLAKTYASEISQNKAVHLRMVQLLKSVFTIVMPAKAFNYAKEKAILRVFDYWNVLDFSGICSKEVKWLGLYEDPCFINPKLKVKASIKYCPDIDYLKFVKDVVKMPSKKTRLFTFGYNIGSYRPQSMADFLADYLKDDPASKIFVYRKYERNKVKYNNLLPVKKYYAAIAQSKYTMVIPSTLTTEVSVLRVNEAIRRKCIPLFTADNNIDKVYSAETCKFIRDNLMFDKSKWQSMNAWIETLAPKYDQLMEAVDNLDFVKAGYALTEDDIVKAIEDA